jgi:hypothetical protein
MIIRPCPKALTKSVDVAVRDNIKEKNKFRYFLIRKPAHSIPKEEDIPASDVILDSVGFSTVSLTARSARIS